MCVTVFEDNASNHATTYTKENLQKLKSEAVDQPPYSPGLALSDFHLFGSLKEAQKGHHFAVDNKAEQEVLEWIPSQPKF
jgi:histone-lysine N-methyltransferase SETMAR